MKSIFNKETTNSLIERVRHLNDSSERQWGKMTPFQMVRHCVLSEEMYQGETKYKRLFIGKLFGKMALKSTLKDEAPFKKNEPTHSTFKITGSGDIEEVKEKWISLLESYPSKGNGTFNGFVHPFFGPMSKEQIGQMVYKHTDHHLRQFGV